MSGCKYWSECDDPRTGWLFEWCTAVKNVTNCSGVLEQCSHHELYKEEEDRA